MRNKSRSRDATPTITEQAAALRRQYDELLANLAALGYEIRRGRCEVCRYHNLYAAGNCTSPDACPYNGAAGADPEEGES